MNGAAALPRARKFVRPVIEFEHKNPVLCIAALAALVTSVIVPPDAEYVGYFDFRTLTCLFCVLAVVCALKNIRFFYLLAKKIVSLCRNLRMSVLSLVVITFVGSMLIANDMALLTFLPLGYFVLKETGKEKYMAFTFIMQNIAANLGGMLTPFGNPQNLYLYSHFAIPDGEFVSIMLPSFLLSVTLIAVCCLFLPAEPLTMPKADDAPLPKKRTAAYLALFALSILIVFRSVPYLVGLIVIPAALFFLDKKALAAVDYPLLLTFVCFFIFSGNLSRVGAVNDLVSGLLNKSTLVVGTLSCQFISNVPSAILLSRFTSNYRDLLVAVNIGGVGTLISSLASLITFREYTSHNPGRTKAYLLRFSAFSFGFLAVLLIFNLLLL
ncbi:MAG: citrate transporter [Lachnospiraceae bacterium]|nr:citrate transporter [Lachnospiraceae bacterium]